jgi:hypothetical protein
VTTPPQSSDPVRKIADAVLYEGYILWPYGRSATKNQRRWTFGGVYPRAHSEGRGDDPWAMRTECLIEANADTRVEVRTRFLQVVERQVMRAAAGRMEPVDELTVAGERYLSWDEAVEREVVVEDMAPLDEPRAREQSIEVPAGGEREELLDGSGGVVGSVERSWRGLSGAVSVSAEPLGSGPVRLRVEVRNESPFGGSDREDALRQTLVSTHTVLRASHGEFLSLTDPPEAFRAEAEACDNSGTWPVLVGDPGDRHTLLSSPIILPDYPEVAQESPGDLFDGAEIDGLLTLSILSLTDDEKREMRDSDPRAREILDRTESLSPEELMRLHGAVREVQAREAS